MPSASPQLSTRPGWLAKTWFRTWLKTWLRTWLCLGLLCPAAAIAAEQLVIDYVISNSPQRRAWLGVIDQFSAANPDIRIIHNGFPQEQYKRDFTARLRNGRSDLAFWYAGERLGDAARQRLLTPLNAELLALLKKHNFDAATLDGTRIQGQVYGFPLYSYVWGFLYRKSLFTRLGLRPPTTWSEFLAVCARLQAAGVTPLAVGAQSSWPAAAWFDYLNLRLNGIDFHRRLLRGDVRFTDARVKQVFDTWGELLRKGYFLAATMEQEPSRVLPYLYREHVGMTLAGSYMTATLPDAIAHDIGMFAFPTLTADVPRHEEAPLDVLVLPARGANPRARQRFLAFLAQSGSLASIAAADRTISAQAGDATTAMTPAEQDSRTIWQGAAGFTYFFDRDARADLVAPMYEGLRRFLRPPHDSTAVLRQIDQAVQQRRQSGKTN
ncbi:MAG: ABC transporter substrate-binding protein [Duganella sp.]